MPVKLFEALYVMMGFTKKTELNCFCDCCFNGDTAAQIYLINTTVEVGQFVQQLSRAYSHHSSDLNTKN